MGSIRAVRRFFVLAFGMISGAAMAGGNGPVRSVPTLDEFALFGLAAAVGAAGIFAILRRRK